MCVTDVPYPPYSSRRQWEMLGEVPAASIFVPGAGENVNSDGRPVAAAAAAPGNDVAITAGSRMAAGGGLPAFTQSPELAQVGEKLDKFKKWTVNTFKNTKQQVFEQWGKIDRTVDTEFEAECETLRELHRRYGVVVASSAQFLAVFEQLGAAEKALAESLYQLSLKEQAVKTQCGTVGESLRTLSGHAAGLEKCLNYFLSTMTTVYEKTIADTLDTIAAADQARVEYDVARHELASLQSSPTASPSAIMQAKEKTDAFRERYDNLKRDVRTKFRLLEENRVKVLTQQLDKLQSALAAYFSGNAQALALSVEELKAMATPGSQSFLQ